MDASTRASRYDLFKMIVAIILLILFFLLLRKPAVQPLSSIPTEFPPTEIVPVHVSATPRAQLVTVTTLPTSSETATLLPIAAPTGTIESASVTSLPSSTATVSDTPSPTPLSSPTATPATASTPIGEPSLTLVVCDDAASRSRLRAGMSAVILRRLNFRSSPGIQNNWLRTNIPGTRAQVIGGPECVPYLTGAYIWWQIELPDGKTGWSAEGSIHGTFYFMEPAPQG